MGTDHGPPAYLSGLYERPARCWKNQDFSCEHCFRNAEEKAVLFGFCPLNRWHAPWTADAAACPTCTLSREQRAESREQGAESREPIERFAELLTRDFAPPAACPATAS